MILLTLARRAAAWLLRPPACPCCRYSQDMHLGLGEDDT